MKKKEYSYKCKCEKCGKGKRQDNYQHCFDCRTTDKCTCGKVKQIASKKCVACHTGTNDGLELINDFINNNFWAVKRYHMKLK